MSFFSRTVQRQTGSVRRQRGRHAAENPLAANPTLRLLNDAFYPHVQQNDQVVTSPPPETTEFSHGLV